MHSYIEGVVLHVTWSIYLCGQVYNKETKQRQEMRLKEHQPSGHL